MRAMTTAGLAVSRFSRWMPWGAERTERWRQPHPPGDRPADGARRIQRGHDPPPHGEGAARPMVEKEEQAMDDRFLHEGRREPRPGFAAELRERLAAQRAGETRR